MLEGQLTKHRRLCECVNYPSIHLHPLIQGRVTVKQVLQTSWGRWDILSLQQVLGLPRGLLPVGRTWKTSKRGAPRGHPDQISEPPQLSPLEVKEQRLYSELPQSWVKLSFGGNSFPSLVHKTLNLKLLCLGWGFMAQPRGDNRWFSGREPWTQHLQILTNHLAANLLDAWWRTQTKEASRNMSSTKSRDATLRLLNGTLSWTSCPWISQTEIKKDNISCAFDIFIFLLWYQKRYGVFFYAGIVWKLRILIVTTLSEA